MFLPTKVEWITTRRRAFMITSGRGEVLLTSDDEVVRGETDGHRLAPLPQGTSEDRLARRNDTNRSGVSMPGPQGIGDCHAYSRGGAGRKANDPVPTYLQDSNRLAGHELRPVPKPLERVVVAQWEQVHEFGPKGSSIEQVGGQRFLGEETRGVSPNNGHLFVTEELAAQAVHVDLGRTRLGIEQLVRNRLSPRPSLPS